MLAFMDPKGEGLVRYSAIMKRMRAEGEPGLAAKVEQEMNDAGRTCESHGYLHDPILGIDYGKMKIVVACPWCSGEEALARWEAQEVSDV